MAATMRCDSETAGSIVDGNRTSNPVKGWLNRDWFVRFCRRE